MWILIDKGGAIMLLLLGSGVIVAAVFLERLFHLHRAQIKTDDFLEGIYNILRRNNRLEAVSICDETPGPAAHIVRAAILHDKDTPARRQQAVEEAGLAEVPRLERNLSLLSTIAQIAPLMGLLGTVLGMIEVFVQLQQHSPLTPTAELAGGIWQALLTTAAGLGVAIPAYAAYNLLVTRVESLVLDMERTAVEILTFMDTRKVNNGEPAS